MTTIPHKPGDTFGTQQWRVSLSNLLQSLADLTKTIQAVVKKEYDLS